MPKTKIEQTETKPYRFTIDAAPKVAGSVCKLTVPRCTPDKLGEIVTELLTKAEKAGIQVRVIKGTLTCY